MLAKLQLKLKSTSRITDEKSGVAAMVQSSRAQGMLMGSASRQITLNLINTNQKRSTCRGGNQNLERHERSIHLLNDGRERHDCHGGDRCSNRGLHGGDHHSNHHPRGDDRRSSRDPRGDGHIPLLRNQWTCLTRRSSR